METVPIIMPILMCLLHNNPLNRRHMSKHLPHILSIVFSCLPDGAKITTTAMVVDLAGNCARDEQCLQVLCSQSPQLWTEHLGVTAMTVLAMKRNSVRGSVHIYYALAFAHSLLSSPKGTDAFFRIFKFNLSHFLTSLSQHFVNDKIEGETKTFLELCLECLNAVLKSEIPIKALAVNHAMSSLMTAFNAHLEHSPVPFSDLVSVIYNLFIYLDHPFSDSLGQSRLPRVLLEQYQLNPVKNAICLYTLARMVKFHSRQMATFLGQDWSDEGMKVILGSLDPRTVKAGLQLLACWLQSSDSHVHHWMKQGGFDTLVDLIKMESKKEQVDGYIAGNAALCLGECARRGACLKRIDSVAEHARHLVKLEAVDPLVQILRKGQEAGVQRNLAIVCARLCQVGE